MKMNNILFMCMNNFAVMQMRKHKMESRFLLAEISLRLQPEIWQYIRVTYDVFEFSLRCHIF